MAETINTIDVTDFTPAELDYLFAVSTDPSADPVGCRPEVVATIRRFAGVPAPALERQGGA